MAAAEDQPRSAEARATHGWVLVRATLCEIGEAWRRGDGRGRVDRAQPTGDRLPVWGVVGVEVATSVVVLTFRLHRAL